jgi:chemotaxis protein MotB
VRREENEEKENSERWLLTYSDLITLLMIFFIVMYTMSKVDSEKYKSVSQSLNSAMGGTVVGSTGGSIAGTGGGSIIGTIGASGTGTGSEPTEEDRMNTIKSDVTKYLDDNGLKDNVNVEISERGLVIQIDNSILFDSGKDEIKDEARRRMILLGNILKETEGYIRVEGHTDNLPIHNSKFKSNWELSSARATNVVELLEEVSGISPERLSAVGYGEFRPVGDNNTEEGRSQNRRVEIVIVSSKFDELENNGKQLQK